MSFQGCRIGTSNSSRLWFDRCGASRQACPLGQIVITTFRNSRRSGDCRWRMAKFGGVRLFSAFGPNGSALLNGADWRRRTRLPDNETAWDKNGTAERARIAKRILGVGGEPRRQPNGVYRGEYSCGEIPEGSHMRGWPVGTTYVVIRVPNAGICHKQSPSDLGKEFRSLQDP